MTLFSCVRKFIVTIKKVLALLFTTVAQSQETAVEDESTVEERKDKRGISLNLGNGLEGYSYLGPSSSYPGRGLNYNRGYTPITEYGMEIDR
jgi:hypothetical protein